MFIRRILLVTLSVASSLAVENTVNDAASAKRAPMGFQGMRGKKDLTMPEQDGLSKRAPMGFQGMRGKKDSAELEQDDELAGRRAMELQDIMSKKNYLMPDFEDSYYNDYYEKNAPPLGYHDMRDKKTFIEDEYYKRAPMGFHGMRGKKSLEEILEDIEKRAIMGFQGMRGKRAYFADYPEDYKKRALTMSFHGMRGKKDDISTDWEKRAPMGFHGMRGKKATLDELAELEKRTVMGFHGMRGKKDMYDNYGNFFVDPMDYERQGYFEFQEADDMNGVHKRRPMGFQGMRGKRDTAQFYRTNADKTTINDQGGSDLREVGSLVPYDLEKRSAFRYFGLRGKKNPRWEIRGKFVGVRGKKWAAFEDSANRFRRVFNNVGRMINFDEEDPTASLGTQ